MITAVEREIGVNHEPEAGPAKQLLLIGHTHQPHRKTLQPSSGEKIDVVSWINPVIATESHKPVFMEASPPDGFVFSFTAPLRDSFEANDPASFDRIRENIRNLEDREYRALGDTYIHAIMPLLPERVQDMLVRLGKKAFKKDLGFDPKGAWVAETAISNTTLRVLFRNGYEFVVLRDDQIKSSEKNPMYVQVCEQDGKVIGEIAVVHFFSDMSRTVSFEDEFTANGDKFLEEAKKHPSKVISVATDTEFYGHHRKGKVEFLRHVTLPATMGRHDFGAFDIKKALSDSNRRYTTLNELTSWSCPHELGRWNGAENCDCGIQHSPSPERKMEKRWLFQTLSDYGRRISFALDNLDPGWEEIFDDLFLGIRKAMFQDGNLETLEQNIREVISNNSRLGRLLEDKTFRDLCLAEVCYLTAMTSCGWFYEFEDGPERKIGIKMLPEIEKLASQIKEVDLSKAA